MVAKVCYTLMNVINWTAIDIDGTFQLKNIHSYDLNGIQKEIEIHK